MNILTLVLCQAVSPLSPAAKEAPAAHGVAAPQQITPQCLPYVGVPAELPAPLQDEAGPMPLALAVTSPIPGSQIDSVERGTALCRTAIGRGWRWLEFHEQWGWGVKATWAGVVPAMRGWVWIDDQRAACHTTGGSSGMTWAPSAQGAACQGCNPYSGDTPRSEARPLICVRQVDPKVETRTKVTK